MRIVFAGTPEFAATALEALMQAHHTVVAVYTQPDRPAGRGQKTMPSAVKRAALEHGLPIEQPLHFQSAESLERLASYQADVMVVAAYGLILPSAVLALPTHGCLNIHASLLPRWRGAAPIQRAILAGDAETGVGIMQMERGLDTGPVLLERRCQILPSDTSQSLHDRLADLGAQALLDVLADLAHFQSQARTQDASAAVYAEKIRKAEAQIDWQQSASQLDRQVRAFYPWPIAQTQWQAAPLRIWAAKPSLECYPDPPGTIVAIAAEHITVACGEGSLQLLQLQSPNKRVLSVAQWLAAQPLKVGDRLG